MYLNSRSVYKGGSAIFFSMDKAKKLSHKLREIVHEGDLGQIDWLYVARRLQEDGWVIQEGLSPSTIKH